MYSTRVPTIKNNNHILSTDVKKNRYISCHISKSNPRVNRFFLSLFYSVKPDRKNLGHRQ